MSVPISRSAYTELNRRGFLIGLFGAAIVAAAGPIPQKLLELPEDQFRKKAEFFASLKAAATNAVEIWGNDKGDYSFAPLPGWRPLRAESDALGAAALGAVAIKQLYEAFL